jgi:hypothetical protein
VPESPWTRAYEENDRQQSLEQRAEEQQINAEGAGIMGAIGMFAAVSLSPAAARKGAKKALRTLGKSSAAGKSFKRVASRARKYADEAGESVGSTAKIADDASGTAGREVARGVDEAHWKKALSKEDFGSRATAAAAYEAKRGGRGYDLTRATKMMGMKGPAKTRDRAKAFREFRQSDAAKEKGTMMALMESTDQRRLLASAASSMKYESAAALPASYAIDSQMGLTGAPEDRAAYNIPGHAKDFMNYLPKYAAYEAGGIGAMGAAGGLFKAGARALKQGLQGNQGAARAVSQTFQGIDAAATRIRKESQAMDARFNRVKNAPSSKWMSKGYEQGREYMMGRYRGAKDAVSRYMGRRASKAKGTGGTSKGAAKLNGSAEGRAQDLFQTKKGKNTVAAMISQEAGKDGTEQFTRRLSDDLFVSGEDRTHSEGLARAFGGEAVNVSEVRKAGFDLRASEQQKLNKIQQGIDDVRHRVQQEAGNTIKPGTREALGQMSAENLRMSGYARVGDEVMRMPTGDEIAAKAAKGINDLTHVNNPFGKGGVSLGRVMGLGAIEDQRAAAQTIEGGLPTATRDEAGNVVDRLHYFEGGKAGQAGTPAGIKDPTDDSVNLHRRGVTVKSNGLREESVFAQSKDGGIQHVGDFFMSSRGNTKAYRVRARQHLPDERYTRSSEKKLSQKSSDPTSTIGRMYDRAKQSLRIGSEYGGGADVMRRTKDYLSDSSPGRLFSKDSDLWNINLSKISEPREAEPLADAVYHSRQAMVRGTDVYTQPQVFEKALRNAGLPEEQLNKLGGAEEILTDSQKAFEAAKGVMKRTEEMATDSARRNLRAPSTPEAKKIIDHVGNDPDALYNASGRSRAQTLRRFVFEQGALGHRAQSSKISELSDDIGRMADKGEIREDLAVEAQVGMESLRMQKSAEGLSNPYRSISEQSTFEVQHDSGLRRAKGIIDEKQDLYEKFGQSRPRLDTSYHRDAHTAPDTFNKPYKETGYFAADYSSRVAGSTFLEAGVDTTRRALSEVGLGWSPETSLTTTSGMKELGKTWARRAGAAVGATFAYRMMDAGTDIALPDDAPLGEGITQELSDIAANSRMAASYIYDQFGITDAAQYMEGLMPKSTSILPGAAAGAYAGGILGAVAGATLNRATQPLLTNTPLESLSILPPLAPFVSDMSESYETTKAKYEGREWVPQRKGRFYLLSSSNYEGERIEQYRPNWYVQESSDYEATSVQYGSEMEEAIYKDLPLIDFAPGDLVDPDYLTEKHAADRPYREQGMPFSEVPLIGPAMGATIGKAYMWMHPGGDMGTPSSVQMDGTVGPTDSQGRPMAGGGNVIHRGSMMQREGTMGPASFSQSHTITSGNAPDQVLDEQFYRLTEAMGFTGFATQSAAGGEGIFQRARMPTSGSIDSTARSYHDAQMGDMLGVGEAMRRLYPYERGGEKAMGPKNTMPDWMPDKLQRGDPYCLAPETLMEANGTLRPAEEVHERLQEGETIHARTHEGRMKEIEASRARPVDEEIVEIEVEGLPWTLAVTEEHPVYVYRNESYQWVLAGEIEEGMTVLEPAGPEGEGLIVGEHETGGAAPNKTYDHTAETTAAVQRLRQTEAPDGNYLSKKGLTYRAEWRIDHALQLEGTSGDRRHSRALARLRRELAEHGLPRSLPGASLSALRPLIQRWGEVRKEEAEVRVQITPDRVRPALEEWNMSRPYRPQTTAEEACRSAAYTLQKALAARGAPASIEQEPRGLSVVLRTRNAAEVLFTKYQIERRHAATRRYSGRKPKVLPRPAEPKHVKRAVTSVERRDYEGPVYAFQVEDDSSFVAAGIATHNSQVKKGEAVLPGEGLESTGRLVGSDPMLEAEDIGRSGYGSAMRMLGLRGDEASRREKWAKERVKQRMLDSGAAIRTEAVYVDNQNDFAAVADAATQGNQPIHIQAVSQAEFRSMENPRELDTQQLNATLGAAGRSKGMVAYVDEQSGDVRTFVQNFDSGLYNKSLQKLQRGRQMAKNYAEQGYGSPGAMYSSVDRLQVLQNADPFGDEWQVEHKKAKKQYYSGNMSPRERSAFERLNKQHDEMRKPFEMHPKRFTPDQLMDPAEKHQNLSYNDNVKAAAEYSLPERVIGSVYESATSMRSPLHTKFFGNPSPKEQYERRVMLERGYQSWEKPVEDFIKPYAMGLAAADDPMQGAASYALGGAVFGNPAIGAVSGVIGSAYGAARGAYESMGGSDYVPSKTQDMRKQSRKLDRFEYYRSKRLYDATGANKYKEKMMETATGWTQAGMEGTGWAKNRRRSYSPSSRLESELYSQDEGFSSPYQGLKKVDDIADAVKTHDSSVLSLTKQSEGKVAKMSGTAGKQMARGVSKGTTAGARTGAPRRLSREASEGSSRSGALAKAQQAANSYHRHGLSPTGMAKRQRGRNTQIQSGRGFASPYRGEDPEKSVQYRARDPVNQPLPPELMTAFKAAPEREKDFVRPFLLAQDPGRQGEIMEMVSPQMGAMLEVGWNYTQGRPTGQATERIRPEGGRRADLMAHPAMGPGADVEGTKIKTLEDSGLSAKEAGLGWQGAMERMEGAIVEPAAIDSVADATRREGGTSMNELRQALNTALLQMGVDAQISIQPSAGPTEVHIREQVG